MMAAWTGANRTLEAVEIVKKARRKLRNNLWAIMETLGNLLLKQASGKSHHHLWVG